MNGEGQGEKPLPDGKIIKDVLILRGDEAGTVIDEALFSAYEEAYNESLKRGESERTAAFYGEEAMRKVIRDNPDVYGFSPAVFSEARRVAIELRKANSDLATSDLV